MPQGRVRKPLKHSHPFPPLLLPRASHSPTAPQLAKPKHGGAYHCETVNCGLWQSSPAREADMATISVVFTTAMDGVTPLSAAVPVASEAVTSSGTSAQSTNTAGKATVCRITAVDGSVWVRFGTNPTAAAGDEIVLAGTSREFGFLQSDFKVAVIDV